MSRTWFRRLIDAAVVYAILAVAGVTFLVPLLWMLSTSLKADEAIFQPSWLPRPPRWENYALALRAIPFVRYAANTLLITAINIAGAVLTAAMVGYAFARLRWPGRDALFIVLLGTMMIPPQVTMIPIFMLFRELGWYNTYLPLTVPAFLGGGAFFIFLLRQFFMTLPHDLEEAALIDGCSHFRTFWSVMLPLTKPALATVGIFTFMAAWNDFMTPLIYLSDDRKWTLALGLQWFLNEHGAEWNLLMAASAVMLLPALVVFFIGQRHFIEGIALTGTKG